MRKWSIRILKILGGAVAVLLLIAVAVVIYTQLTWDSPRYKREGPQLKAPADRDTIARGEYLYKYGNQCWSCHVPGTPADPEALPVGGREFDLTKIGPGFGRFYATNLTPDKETGIGDWTDTELVRAIREGVDREGLMLFPIMPADYYWGISDRDALAIVAYLRTLTPTRNQTPPNQHSFATKALSALKIVQPSRVLKKSVEIADVVRGLW